MSIVVADLAYAHPGDRELFAHVTFKIGDGEHVALVGENGAGKSTLLRLIAGDLAPTDGEARTDGELLLLRQDIGFVNQQTIRDLLVELAPASQRPAGRQVLDAERRLAAGDPDAGLDLGLAIGTWAEQGGYETEGRWDASVRRILGRGLGEVGDRPVTALSGGELKRLAIDALFASEADVLLLDEPDNYLDIPAKLWLEELIAASKKTILSISHDREFLAHAFGKVVTLEGEKTWVHGASYATYAEARSARQQLLHDDLERWNDEERRLFQHMKIMKQRAAVNFKNATKANAAETRWERFVAAGPPPPPVVSRQIQVTLRGADAGRRVLTMKAAGLDGLIQPFSDEVHHGERVGLIGPNGAGKSHLLRLLAGELPPSTGTVQLGSRVSTGTFTQVNDRPDFLGRTLSDIVRPRAGNHEAAMKLLARYGLAAQVDQRFETLSGGQKARLEVLALEVEGHNLLLLDEPTDNLDAGSSDALEGALAEFDGTCISVSHDRAFLRHQDRFWLLDPQGALVELTDYDDALDAVVTGTLPRNHRVLVSPA